MKDSGPYDVGLQGREISDGFDLEEYLNSLQKAYLQCAMEQQAA